MANIKEVIDKKSKFTSNLKVAEGFAWKYVTKGEARKYLSTKKQQVMYFKTKDQRERERNFGDLTTDLFKVLF